jgi:protein-S-isoprenylcysteine O-methyltransferase Ste14
MENANPPAPPASPSDDRPNRLPWPPILYVAVLVAAYGLERVAPLDILPHASAWRSGGWVLFTLGIAAGVAGIVQFRAIGTPVDPTGQARKLARAGIYQYTRNPMYLGAVVGFVGLAFAVSSAWLLGLSLLLPVALRKLAIDGEEAYLKRRFGAAYDSYCNSVRRWV